MTSQFSTGTGAANGGGQAQAICRRLDALAKQKPELFPAAAFYCALLPILYADQPPVTPFTMEAETAQRKLEMGLPLLVGEDLPLNTDAMRALFLQLCRLIEASCDGQPPAWPAPLSAAPKVDPALLIDQWGVAAGEARIAGVTRSAAASRILHAAESGELNLVAIWQALAGGRWQEGETLAMGLQLDPGVLRMLAEYSLIPTLVAWEQTAFSQVDLDLWGRGTCPICGSQPILSEIQGKGGAGRLRCAMCGADWYYPRLRCAYCGNEDYRSMGIISVEGQEEKHHLQTCDACRGYIKVVVTFDPTPVGFLAVEDLATLHLDLIARQHGFARVPVRSLAKGWL